MRWRHSKEKLLEGRHISLCYCFKAIQTVRMFFGDNEDLGKLGCGEKWGGDGKFHIRSTSSFFLSNSLRPLSGLFQEISMRQFVWLSLSSSLGPRLGCCKWKENISAIKKKIFFLLHIIFNSNEVLVDIQQFPTPKKLTNYTKWYQEAISSHTVDVIR